MNRNEFVKKKRKGIKGILFPHSINRTQLLIRAVIIGICIGLPLRALNKSAESKIETLSQEASLLVETINLENPETEMLDETILQLESIQSKAQLNAAVVFTSVALSFAVYILSFWMMFIPRIRNMGQSPKLAWLMAIPVVNALFAWVLIFAPPKY